MNNPYILMCISDINKRKETLQEKNKKWTKELQDGKMNILDQLITKKDIHTNQKKIEKIDNLIKKIHQFENETKSFTEDKLFSNLKVEIENLTSYLTPKEREELTKIVSREILTLRGEEQKKVSVLIEEIKNLLNSLNLSSVDFKIEGTSLFVKYDHFMEEIKKATLEKISTASPYFGVKETKNTVFDHTFIDELEEMLTNGKIEMTPAVKKLKNNISQVKSSWLLKERIELVITSLDKTLAIISKDLQDVDMIRLVKYLETLKQRYLKDLQKLNTYLNSFNLTSCKEQIEKEKKIKILQQDQKMALLEYENLFYELEKVLMEEPNNYDKKMVIEAKMRVLTSTVKLSNDALLDAKSKGKQRYYSKKNEKQSLKEVMTKKVKIKRDYLEEENRIFREEAMRQLKDDDFEETYEFRNGDAYLANLDKEAIIAHKTEEMKRFAKMTPEERGLSILKEKGKISRDATLGNLTPQQLSDMRYAYRDSSYPYIMEYKKLKQESNDKEERRKPNTLHKEYLRYRASCIDKTNFLTFREFVNKKYNLTAATALEPAKEANKIGGPKI
uniref:hypothetical protein n=1 Tax=Candidatus Ventrenecus sp. TaxID=3085654 RepID=UPI003FF09471